MRTHTVKPGESLSKIAQSYEFPNWQVVYQHPKNASLRHLRPNPNLIRPGDVVFIPEKSDSQPTIEVGMAAVVGEFKLEFPILASGPPFPYERAIAVVVRRNASAPVVASASEPYEGELGPACLTVDFSHAYAVVVSGVWMNPCGHMILNVGGVGGWYFHIAEWHNFPRYMDERGYRRYLADNHKREIRRTPVPLPHPEAANRRLCELLGERWQWGILPHNCATFVEEVLQAGGTNAGLYSNCPTAERFR